jgi:archaellum biogenesis ATPase FlaH
VEGSTDSGKSILAQHITYGALTAGKRVIFISKEDTAKGLITNMRGSTGT